MAEILKRAKALSVSPLKTSQPIGAALAFLGINRSVPMLHGSQGCTAFGKVFFVRHFREPIPLQTTAMDQVSSIMGADENVIEGLRVLCEKSRPALIGLPTTGLSETQGTDIKRLVKEFRAEYPEFADVAVVPVNTPDFSGCFESGYAAAVTAMIDELVPPLRPCVGERTRQVNVLVSSMLTPGDVEALKDIISSFGLEPLVLPDLSDSLDGRLTDDAFNPLTIGGTPVAAFATLGAAAATVVVGPSLYAAADLLAERTGVPVYRFPHLLGLAMMDQLLMALARISGEPVPTRQERERARLQDTLVDTHFMLGQARFALALDADHLLAFSDLLTAAGAEVVAAVAPARGPALDLLPGTVKLGDLEDLEQMAQAAHAELLISNSHAVASAERLNLPLLRAGFPQYDLLGGYQRTWIGYAGARQALFDLANLRLSQHHGEIAAYHSPYAQKPATEDAAHAA